MPRSIQDIIDHADGLSDQFEQFDLDAARERPVEEYLLERAVIARAACEQEVLRAVAAARTAGLSWRKIGSIVGSSAQAAHQLYGPILATDS